MNKTLLAKELLSVSKLLTAADDLKIYFKLVHILTEYDKRQSTRAGYNKYALSHYLGAAQEAEDMVKKGSSWFEALSENFIYEGGKFAIVVLNKFAKENGLLK